MKKILCILAAAAAVLTSSCNKIDPVRDMAEYTDYVVCSYDNALQSAFASDYANFKIKGDMTTGLYTLVVGDVPLYEGSPLRTDTLSRLIQFMENKQPGNADTTKVRYMFFQKQPSTRQSGDLQLNKMRFGWLSTQAWFTAEAQDGRYSLWSLPQTVRTYANRNTISGPGGTIDEISLSPRYDVRLNTASSTVTFKATAVKYPVDVTDPSKTLSIASMTWENLPVKYTAGGFTAASAEFVPRITGKIGSTEIADGDFVISNFHCTFAADYGSPRTLSFVLYQKSTGLQLSIGTDLEYYLPDNYI